MHHGEKNGVNVESIPSLTSFCLIICTGLFHCLKKTHLVVRVVIIHFPSPRGEVLLNWIQVRRIWRKEHHSEMWVMFKPLLHQCWMMKLDTVPDNYEISLHLLLINLLCCIGPRLHCVPQHQWLKLLHTWWSRGRDIDYGTMANHIPSLFPFVVVVVEVKASFINIQVLTMSPLLFNSKKENRCCWTLRSLTFTHHYQRWMNFSRVWLTMSRKYISLFFLQ